MCVRIANWQAPLQLMMHIIRYFDANTPKSPVLGGLITWLLLERVPRQKRGWVR
jgi:hypothetical protein